MIVSTLNSAEQKMSKPTLSGIDRTKLSEQESYALNILENLTNKQLNKIKNLLLLSHPNIIGLTTIEHFLKLCAKYDFDLSKEGVKKFKAKHQLSDNGNLSGVIGKTTALVYYKEIFKQPLWMEIATAEMKAGVKEIPGEVNNPRIVEYHRSTIGTFPDETPWCSSFTCWCFEQAKLPHPKTAWAYNWRTWRGVKKLTQPKYGCIVVLGKSAGGADGHVGFFVEKDGKDKVKLLGGNQGDAVNISTFSINDRGLQGYYWPIKD